MISEALPVSGYFPDQGRAILCLLYVGLIKDKKKLAYFRFWPVVKARSV
jgi:hypothetical protein